MCPLAVRAAENDVLADRQAGKHTPALRHMGDAELDDRAKTRGLSGYAAFRGSDLAAIRDSMRAAWTVIRRKW